MKKLSNIEATKNWTSALQEAGGEIPFAFNPDLYDFYADYFHWKPYYIFFKKDNITLALLPIVFTGQTWVSLPHLSHGGILHIHENTESDDTSIINFAISQLKGKPSGFYEMDFPSENISAPAETKFFIRSGNQLLEPGFVGSEKQNSIMYLLDNNDDMFMHLSPNLRRKIRKAKQEGVSIKSGNENLLEDFYSVYSKSIMRLKSMAYPKSYFKALIEVFGGEKVTIFVSYRNEIPVGAAFMSSFGNYHENLYFASNPEAQKHYVSDALHWCMIKESIKRNQSSAFKSKSIYSFGRSTKGSGVFQYKNHWPVENQSINIYTNMADAPTNVLLQSAWKNLPSFIRKPLGKRLVKHVY